MLSVIESDKKFFSTTATVSLKYLLIDDNGADDIIMTLLKTHMRLNSMLSELGKTVVLLEDNGCYIDYLTGVVYYPDKESALHIIGMIKSL